MNKYFYKFIITLLVFVVSAFIGTQVSAINPPSSPNILITGSRQLPDYINGGIIIDSFSVTNGGDPKGFAGLLNTDLSFNITVNGPSLIFNWFTVTIPPTGETYQATLCSVRETEAGKDINTHYFSSPTSKSYSLKLTSEKLGGNYHTICGGIGRELMILGVPCEASFQNIVSDLNEFEITNITEESFKSWAKNDEPDHCSYNTNGTCSVSTGVWDNPKSGDKKDILAAMYNTQCQWLPPKSDPFSSLGRIQVLKTSTDKGFPMAFGILNIGKKDERFSDDKLVVIHQKEEDFWGHSLIGLNVEGSGSAANEYKIKVLDPNGPEIKNITCEKSISKTIKIFTDDGTPTFEGSAPEYLCKGLNDENSIFIIRSLRSNNEHEQAFTNYCKNARSQYKFCTERGFNSNNINKANITGWLESNYPDLTNPHIEGGICWGWTDFVLKVSYLGQFLGAECPRGDGENNNEPQDPPKSLLINGLLPGQEWVQNDTKQVIRGEKSFTQITSEVCKADTKECKILEQGLWPDEDNSVNVTLTTTNTNANSSYYIKLNNEISESFPVSAKNSITIPSLDSVKILGIINNRLLQNQNTNVTWESENVSRVDILICTESPIRCYIAKKGITNNSSVVRIGTNIPIGSQAYILIRNSDNHQLNSRSQSFNVIPYPSNTEPTNPPATSTEPIIEPKISSISTTNQSSSWIQGTSRDINWVTTGNIPRVDILVCTEINCFTAYRNIPNNNFAKNVRVGTNIPAGSVVTIKVRKTGDDDIYAISPIFNVITSQSSQQVSAIVLVDLFNKLINIFR